MTNGHFEDEHFWDYPEPTLVEKNNAARVEYLMVRNLLFGLPLCPDLNFYERQEHRFEQSKRYLKEKLSIFDEDIEKAKLRVQQASVSAVDTLAALGATVNLAVHLVESDARERETKDTIHYGTIELFGRKAYGSQDQWSLRKALQERVIHTKETLEGGFKTIRDQVSRIELFCLPNTPTLQAIDSETLEYHADIHSRLYELSKSLNQGPLSYTPPKNLE